MKKLWKSSEQRGTLLVEAIAMLALIAMVTPTLYRKSAERLQEIQDINIASQMRTLNAVVNSFIKANSGSMIELAKQNAYGKTFKLSYEDTSSAGYFTRGYSSMVPFGYNPYDIKNFLSPEVYVYGTDGLIQYYIVYGKESEIGKKRATRLASLVGANGGVINKGGVAGGSSITVNGTGNAWSLDQDKIDEIGLDSGILTEDSLMVTATEPIVIDQDENDVYLYRVPPTDNDEGAYYKNTMITDLYMGGYDASGTYSDWAKDYFSIFNVRKLTMNTKCTNDVLTGINPHEECIPEDVADLYIGKPTGTFLNHPGEVVGGAGSKTRYYKPNEGAAWIYGNLSALNDNFRVFRGGLDGTEDGSTVVGRTTGYDVMQFARLNNQEANKAFETYDDSTSVDLQVFRASNELDSARVSLMDGLVNVVEKFDPKSGNPEVHAFLVGKASSGVEEGNLIAAYHELDYNHVDINNREDGFATTRINPYGGNVWINKIKDASSLAPANTYINDDGGTLLAGREAEWIEATGEGGSAVVNLLKSNSSTLPDTRRFTVGNTDVLMNNNMIYADSTRTSLRGDRLRVYNKDMSNDLSSSAGGKIFVEGLDPLPVGQDIYEGATVVGTQLLDVLGSTYLGGNVMLPEPDDGATYTRGAWNLGVAGSAWVDKTLWARRGWLKQGGMAELHAGFSSFEEFDTNPTTGWLNVYNNKDDGVIIRNKDAIAGVSDSSIADDLLFKADSKGVEIWGNPTGAADSSTVTFAEWRADKVMIGAAPRTGTLDPVAANVFAANYDAANVQGSTLVNIYTANGSTDGVVNVQDGAMQFRGIAGSSGVYGNEILTQARWFGVTADSSFVEEENVQFRVGSSDAMANASEVRVRNADFAVRDSSGVGKLWVRPDEDVVNSSLANVNVDGSLYVTGNEIIHIASNEHNTSEKDSQHAMFEIDPNYVQVWAKTPGGSSYAGSSGADYYAMLRINPYDTEGGASVTSDTEDASIYVRKGAIELMPSEQPLASSSGVSASEGFGYIKANRLVSNTGLKVALNVDDPDHKGATAVGGVTYDEYMVNPAYTSVMHDIKLTTRGGGRLSDILPDYVLKGVYNVSNDFEEGSKTNRIGWSAGSQCGKNGISCTSDPVKWANAYVGKIPYGLCPPGYVNLATIMPISFMMGQAGEIMKSTQSGWGGSPSGHYYVNFDPAQYGILEEAFSSNTEIGYPGYHKVRSVTLEGLSSDVAWQDGNYGPEDFKTISSSQIEGWFMGVPYEGEIHDDLGEYDQYMTGDASKTNVGVWRHKDHADGDKEYIMAQPLYFQQNTWLKTSVAPNSDGYWDAYMGFIYDATKLATLGRGQGSEGLVSNNSDTGSSTVFQGYGDRGDFVWNLFPVPTNSIEGHATVYCYFDRENFKNYSDNEGNPLVDVIDQMGEDSFRNPGGNKLPASGDERVREYLDRLDDPTLKYKNPW